MTLIEMMVAVSVFGLVAAGALSFFTTQSRAFRRGNERLDVVQNLRFTADILDRELRTMGANVPVGQPFMVYAGADAVAYSADFSTNIAGDPWAVYFDPDLPAGAVTTIQPANQIVIPTGAFAYPQVAYTTAAATTSPAELIVFYFVADGTTARNDDFQLMRQVNNLAPELVARNLLRTANQSFFEYTEIVAGPPIATQIVPGAVIPLAHTEPVHLGPLDVAPVNRIDNIRGVRVRFTATNGLAGGQERTRAISRLIRLPNAPFSPRRQTCGDEPLNGTNLVVAPGVSAFGDPFVRLTWNQSIDEAGGEEDVEGYTVWRRLFGAPDWGDPYLTFPAGLPNYLYEDYVVTSGDVYQYAIAAQDCTPSLSVLATAGPVAIP
jgi:prepilin-type N-terminal cleavage/methylation domain-containing protein